MRSTYLIYIFTVFIDSLDAKLNVWIAIVVWLYNIVFGELGTLSLHFSIFCFDRENQMTDSLNCVARFRNISWKQKHTLMKTKFHWNQIKSHRIYRLYNTVTRDNTNTHHTHIERRLLVIQTAHTQTHTMAICHWLHTETKIYTNTIQIRVTSLCEFNQT